MRSTLSIQMRWGFWEKPMRITFEEACYGILNRLAPDAQRKAYNDFRWESGRAAFEIGFWPVDSDRASSVLENKVKIPLLVVGATEDRMTPAAVVRKVAEKYRKVATYMEFSEHSHWLLEEPGWEEVAGAVEGWIRLKRRSEIAIQPQESKREPKGSLLSARARLTGRGASAAHPSACRASSAPPVRWCPSQCSRRSRTCRIPVATDPWEYPDGRT